VLLLEVLEDRDCLAEHAPVVELEGGHLAAGILGGVGRRPVLAGEEVDALRGQLELLLQEEHPERSGIGAEGIVHAHVGNLRDGGDSSADLS